MACEVLKCKCTHEFQDKQYGKNMRVFNPTGKDGKSGYRCSVCGAKITYTLSK